jgi:hypothetical protein
MRSILGRDTVIEGELTREGEKVVVTVRTAGRSSASFSDDIEQLDAILSRAADQIMLVTQPLIAAVFRRNNGDTAGAAEALSRCVTAGNARVVGWAALTQGRMAQAAGDLEGAAARFDTSIRASPMVAWAYESLRLMVSLRALLPWSHLAKPHSNGPKPLVETSEHEAA